VSVDAFLFAFEVIRQVRKWIREEVRRELGRSARPPPIIVLHDVPPTKDGKPRAAYYDPRRREIVVSAKYVEELLKKDGGSARCKLINTLFHELQHHIDCAKHRVDSVEDEEIEAEQNGLCWEILCYAGLV
jgi:hypothetical protein